MAPRILILFNILIFIYFFKYETIETHARAFLTLNILAMGRVGSPGQYWKTSSTFQIKYPTFWASFYNFMGKTNYKIMTSVHFRIRTKSLLNMKVSGNYQF